MRSNTLGRTIKLIIFVAIGLCCRSLEARAAGLDFTLIAVQSEDQYCNVVIEIFNGSSLNLTAIYGDIYARDKDDTVADKKYLISPRVKQNKSVQIVQSLKIQCEELSRVVIDLSAVYIDGRVTTDGVLISQLEDGGRLGSRVRGVPLTY